MARYEGMRSGLDDRYSVVHHTEPSYVQHIRMLDRGYEDDPSEDEIEAKLTDDDVLLVLGCDGAFTPAPAPAVCI